jgi:hypothetical protein
MPIFNVGVVVDSEEHDNEDCTSGTTQNEKRLDEPCRL